MTIRKSSKLVRYSNSDRVGSAPGTQGPRGYFCGVWCREIVLRYRAPCCHYPCGIPCAPTILFLAAWRVFHYPGRGRIEYLLKSNLNAGWLRARYQTVDDLVSLPIYFPRITFLNNGSSRTWISPGPPLHSPTGSTQK